MNWSDRVIRFQLALFLAWVVLLIAPAQVPDPLGLGQSLSWTAVCLLGATSIWLPDLLARHWPSTTLDPVLGVYVAVVGLASIAGVNRHQSLIAVLALAGNLGIFYVTVILARKATWLAEALLLVLVGAIALILLMALAYHAEQGLLTRPKEYPVPAGWSGYPELGTLAVIQFGILLAGFQAARRAGPTFAIAILAIVNLVEVMFLYSRASWLSVGVIGVLATVLVVIGRGQVHRLLLIAGLLAVVGTVLVTTNPTVRYLARVVISGEQAKADAPTGYSLAVATPDMRIQIWSRTVRMISEHAVRGVGLGNFRQVFETTYNPELNEDGRRGVHAHNLWLQQFAEVGVIGGLAYLGLWVQVGWRSWRGARLRPGFLRFALLFSILAVATSNVVTNMFYLTGGASGRLQSLTWMLFGLVIATSDAFLSSSPVTTGNHHG